MIHDDLEVIQANSYKDFHAKGLDYICVRRSPSLTEKVYFLNGDVTKLPEVVNPHDHRYDFNTTVLAGAYVDHVYRPHLLYGDVYQLFDYMTPLNGGNGFTWRGEMRLMKTRSELVEKHSLTSRAADTIHTIQMMENQTVLLLRQYADKVPLSFPTKTYVPKGEPKPDTSGLYTQFSLDEIRSRLGVIENLLERYRG